MKNKIKFILIIVIVLLLLAGIWAYFYIQKENRKREEIKRQQEIAERISIRKSHYDENVITTRETTLYNYENGEYIEYGKINNNVKIKLESIDLQFEILFAIKNY